MDEEQRIRENLSLKFSPSPSNAPPVLVALPNGTKYTIPIDANFDNVAGRAVEYVRNRRQWRKLASARDYIEEILDTYFPRNNASRDNQLREMARAGVVEIQVPTLTAAVSHSTHRRYTMSHPKSSPPYFTSRLCIQFRPIGSPGHQCYNLLPTQQRGTALSGLRIQCFRTSTRFGGIAIVFVLSLSNAKRRSRVHPPTTLLQQSNRVLSEPTNGGLNEGLYASADSPSVRSDPAAI